MDIQLLKEIAQNAGVLFSVSVIVFKAYELCISIFNPISYVEKLYALADQVIEKIDDKFIDKIRNEKIKKDIESRLKRILKERKKKIDSLIKKIGD